jgi:putative ABC transport system permease protein
MNSIIVAFQLAWRSLRLNILRTSLTVLGVVIGVAAIVVVFAAGDGITRLVYGEIESYGTNVVQTEVKVPGKEVAATAEITSLKLDDMAEIDKLDNVSMSYAVSLGQQKITYGGEGKKVLLFGVSAPYVDIDSKTKVIEGSFFSAEEDDSQAAVIVLGSALREYLFGDSEAVGKFVRVGSQRFWVIGSLAEQGGGFSFLDFNDSAYIPIQTLHNKILGIDYALYFMHQLRDIDRAEETAEEIRLILRDRHEISDPEKDDFRVSTMTEMLDTLGTVTSAVTFLLLAIVLISLLVGGVGIMNIMYVTVTERTPEIGLRKAMGATAKDVVRQFLIESLLITFWGWLLGVVLGLLFSYLLTLVAQYFQIDWFFSLPLDGIVVSLLFSLACGLLFGYRPAKQAARLDPVTALRTE